jgi:polyhydroxyalkanoate synthase
LDQVTWDDYIEEGAITAINTVKAISGQKQLSTFGFCVGGTILSTALAVLAARGEHPAASVTLLTTLLDFSNTGVLDVFVDEMQVTLRENDWQKRIVARTRSGKHFLSIACKRSGLELCAGELSER